MNTNSYWKTRKKRRNNLFKLLANSALLFSGESEKEWEACSSSSATAFPVSWGDCNDVEDVDSAAIRHNVCAWEPFVVRCASTCCAVSWSCHHDVENINLMAAVGFPFEVDFSEGWCLKLLPIAQRILNRTGRCGWSNKPMRAFAPTQKPPTVTAAPFPGQKIPSPRHLVQVFAKVYP